MSTLRTWTPVGPTRTRRSASRPKRPSTAFVLSGGASLGALQVGMLRALYERGIAADMFVATSIGALNAAFVASRSQTPATVDELAHAWSGLHREDVFPVSVRTLVGGLSGQRDHLVSGRALRRQVSRYIELEDLSEASVPLHVVAFDVLAGHEVLLSEGPALDAIAAAAALPGIFPPVPIGGRHLVDGSVTNHTPISHAVELGAERVYVLRTQERGHQLRRAPRGALDTAIHTLGAAVDGRMKADLARYSGDVEVIVLPAPNSLEVQPTDFSSSQRLIREACAASRTALTGMPARRRGTIAAHDKRESFVTQLGRSNAAPTPATHI
jgi:NTE family protein